MPSDFFAVIWNAARPDEIETVQQIHNALTRSCEHLAPAFSASGFSFHVNRRSAALPQMRPLTNGAGLVFGTFFRRKQPDGDGAPSPSATLSEFDSLRTIMSGGRYLVDQYWGHYLAFLIDERHGKKYVLRSPACHQPCLWAVYRGVRMYFSAAEDCVALRLLGLTVNWDFVAAFAMGTRASGRETGLTEIRELGTGECHKISVHADSHEHYWNPAEVARQPLDEAPRDSARRLRAAVISCVSTWANQHTHIVHRLSGGLDSSIAAVCLRLAASRPGVICLNYYTRGAYGDERLYARVISRATGFPLMEYPRHGATSMARLLRFPLTVSPASYLNLDGCDPREIELARSHSASAIFTGILGDMLFHMPPAARSVADYIRVRRLDRRFLALVLEAAQMDRVSIWTILRGALANGIFKPPTSFIPGEFEDSASSLLTREAAQSVYSVNPHRFIHPWLRDLRGVPYGKFPLIGSLSWNSAYFGARSEAREPELIHPFFSEPLIELCLRLPSFSMLRDGWDRALIRQVFEPELPEIIGRRTSKGSPNLYVRERIEHNKPFIQDLLLDGVLVKQRILDRKKVMDCLPGQTTRSGTSLGRLWACVAAEAWSRAWTQSRLTEQH